MIVIVPQVGRDTISTSSGFEVKLGELRDTQVWLAKHGSVSFGFPTLRAWVRLIPNSANALGLSCVPLMPLFAALIVVVLTLPSNRPAWLMLVGGPQHGGLSE